MKYELIHSKLIEDVAYQKDFYLGISPKKPIVDDLGNLYVHNAKKLMNKISPNGEIRNFKLPTSLFFFEQPSIILDGHMFHVVREKRNDTSILITDLEMNEIKRISLGDMFINYIFIDDGHVFFISCEIKAPSEYATSLLDRIDFHNSYVSKMTIAGDICWKYKPKIGEIKFAQNHNSVVSISNSKTIVQIMMNDAYRKIDSEDTVKYTKVCEYHIIDENGNLESIIADDANPAFNNESRSSGSHTILKDDLNNIFLISFYSDVGWLESVCKRRLRIVVLDPNGKELYRNVDYSIDPALGQLLKETPIINSKYILSLISKAIEGPLYTTSDIVKLNLLDGTYKVLFDLKGGTLGYPPLYSYEGNFIIKNEHVNQRLITLYCIDYNGNILWELELNPMLGSPEIITKNNYLYVLNKKVSIYKVLRK